MLFSGDNTLLPSSWTTKLAEQASGTVGVLTTVNVVSDASKGHTGAGE